MTGPRDISQKDRTEYLVFRKFPLARALDFPTSLNDGCGRPTQASPQLREALAAYRAELASLSSEEIVSRYNSEKQREYQIAVEKTAQEERERFFNQPYAAADFEHWSRLAHWTLDEAVALSFGKSPERVNWEKILKFLQLSPFAVQYSRRREMALRAAQWNQLYDPVLPGIFLAWAKRLDIDVPSELVEAVQKRGLQIADWKSLYEQAAAGQQSAIEMYERATEMHDSQIADWRRLYDQAIQALQAARDQQIEILEEKTRLIAALEERVASSGAADASLARPPAEEKQLSTKERETLLKIIIGMARDSYKYNPKLNRSSVPQEIADDLAKHSIFLDVDTVRKWLKQAAEFMPGE